MEFLSVRATAERWGVSMRNVQRLLKEDRHSRRLQIQRLLDDPRRRAQA